MRGRNTTRISIRLDDTIVSALQNKAGELTVGEYIKRQILKSYSVSTTDKLKTAGLNIRGNRITLLPKLDDDGNAIPEM